MNWKKTDKTVNYFFNRIGLSLKRFPSREQRRLLNYLHKHHINYLLDVGANTGQFTMSILQAGYKGQIISFEPQSAAYQKLLAKTLKRKDWKAYHFAIGNLDGPSEINISKNSVSSSLLDILPAHVKAAPESSYVSKEVIEVKKLESIYHEIIGDDFAFLKMDTQGFEMNVLKGAAGILNKISGIQLEMSCYPLYSKETTFDEMKAFIESKGFFLSSLENGFVDENTGRLLQVDAVFLRDVL